MEETKEVMDVIEVAPEDVEIMDLPPVEESSGFSTIKGAVGLAAGAAVVGLGIIKGSQAIYKKRCEKKGTGMLAREKKYQFWRPKAKKAEAIPAKTEDHDDEEESED